MTGESPLREQGSSPRSESGWIVALAALVGLDLLHRLLQIAAGPFPLEGDALSYWGLGHALRDSGSLLAVDPAGFRTPLYPAFLALFQAAAGSWALQWVVVAQNLLGVLTSGFVAVTCRRVSGADWAAPAGYALSAACLGRIQYDQMVMSEPLFVALLAAHLWLLFRALDSRSRGRFLGAGALLGAAALVRPVGWPLAAIGALALAAARGRRARGETAQALVLVLVGAALPLAAWTLRNAIEIGSPVLFRSAGVSGWEHAFRPQGGGLELPEGALAELLGAVDPRNGWEVQAALRDRGWDPQARARWMSSVVRGAAAEQRAAYHRRLAANGLRFWFEVEEAHPFYLRPSSVREGTYGDQKLFRLEGLVRPFSSYLRWVYRYPRWGQAVVSAIAVLAALRLALASGRRRTYGFLALAWTAYFWLVTVLFMYPLYRFRMVLDPLWIAGVVSAGVSLRSRGRRDGERATLRPGAVAG